ncbi:MAG: carboxypeptidase-like regulatory domain-containing protein, partial [Algoriphagus sp.]
MNSRNLLLTTLFFFSLLKVYAQTSSIKGTVTTSDNQPIEFVNVGIEGLAKGNATNRNGFFEIKNIAPGSYTLFASFVGIETQMKTVQLSAGETLSVNFILKESSTELSEVIVTDLSSNRFYT